LGPKFSFPLRNCQNRAGRRRLTLRYEYRCGQHRSGASNALFATCSWYFGHHCLGFRAGTAHFRAKAHRYPQCTSIPHRLHLEAAEANASFSPMSTGRSSAPPFRGAQVARHRRCCYVCGISQLSNLTQPVAVVPTLHVGARWSREQGFIHAPSSLVISHSLGGIICTAGKIARQTFPGSMGYCYGPSVPPS
jgi:hypothetical protein